MSDEANVEFFDIASDDANVGQGTTTSSFKMLLPQITAAAIAASFYLIAGISYNFPYIFFAQLRDESSDLDVTADEAFWIVAVMFFANSAAGIFCGVFMDTFGRLNTIKLSTVWTLVAWIMVAFAKDGTTMIAARIITGFSVAWSVCPGIVYIAEIAHPDFRGSLISFTSVFQSLGTLAIVIEEMFISWKLIVASVCVYAVVVFVLLLVIPESPLWLISKGRTEDTRNVFTGGFVAKLKQFLKPSVYKPLIILSGLLLFRQFLMLYLRFFYSPEFFKYVGSGLDFSIFVWFDCILQLIVNTVNIYLFKVFRRRTLLIYGCAGMGLWTFISGLAVFLIKQGVGVSSWITVTTVILYSVSFTISLLPIPLMLAAEIFPTEIRGTTYSLIFSIVSFSSYWVYFVGDYQFYDWIHYIEGSASTQWIFAALALAASIFAYFFFPETHKTKLTDVQRFFDDDDWRWGKIRRSAKDGKREGNTVN